MLNLTSSHLLSPSQLVLMHLGIHKTLFSINLHSTLCFYQPLCHSGFLYKKFELSKTGDISRTTDIWRSFIAQKILHLSGLTVSFVPTNAVQFRNAHDYLKDFKDEKQVYEDSGKMIQYLHDWKCAADSLKQCVIQLAENLAEEKLWGFEDSNLIKGFLEDLENMGYIDEQRSRKNFFFKIRAPFTSRPTSYRSILPTKE